MYKWLSYFMPHSPALSLDTHLTKLPSLDLNALEWPLEKLCTYLLFLWAERVGIDSRVLHMLGKGSITEEYCFYMEYKTYYHIIFTWNSQQK